MPGSALSPRADRRSAGPGRGAGRRPGEPALTVTLAIPLTGETVSPQAHRLLAAVRELVELSRGTVTVEPGAAAAVRDAVPGAVSGVVEVFESPADAPRVRLLSGSRQALLEEVPLALTRLEFDLLLYLAERPRRVFSRAQLLAAVWGYERAGERTVDVHVRRLRLKLGTGVPAITTVYGVGYRLADDARVSILPHD